MREHAPLPILHAFVCANRREPSSPLGPGCGDAGEAVYAALKDAVARQGAFARVWITKTHCLGICPRRGCTVALYPRQRIIAEVTPEEALELIEPWTKKL